jgi:cell shape-determining protein MreC
MKKVLVTIICAAMFASCGQNSADYKQLQAENDSLKLENAKSSTELNEMLSILNEVETNFQSIRDAENYLSMQQQGGVSLIRIAKSKSAATCNWLPKH